MLVLYCYLIDVGVCSKHVCHSGECVTDRYLWLHLRLFSCRCSGDKSGRFCEVGDECLSRPCLNGGVCTDHTDSYSCTCRLGYYGSRCQHGPRKYNNARFLKFAFTLPLSCDERVVLAGDMLVLHQGQVEYK